MIPKHELAAFRELTDKTTQGPWTVDEYGEIYSPSLGGGIGPSVVAPNGPVLTPEGPGAGGLRFHSEADRDFILQARTMVPRLLADFDSLLEAYVVDKAKLFATLEKIDPGLPVFNQREWNVALEKSYRSITQNLQVDLDVGFLPEPSAWRTEIEFQDQYFKDWREWKASFLSTALDGESGEFTHEAFPTEFAILHLRFHVARGKTANLVKKLEGGGTNRSGKYTPQRVIEELADVFIYLVLLAEVLGYDEHKFRDVVREKVQKNMNRMSPGQWV